MIDSWLVYPVPQRIDIPAPTQRTRIDAAIRSDAGPLIRLAEQPGVEDVVTNADGKIWVKRRGSGFSCEGEIIPDTVGGILARIAKQNRLLFSDEHPVLETDLFVDGSPASGSRITGISSPVVRETVIAIRPHSGGVISLDDYDASGVLTEKGDPLNEKTTTQSFLQRAEGLSHKELLALAVDTNLNIIVAGATGSGKTTLVNAMLSRVGKTTGDRVVVIQDTRELKLADIRNHVDLLATDAVPMRKCLKATLRLAPHRIVIGEVRDQAAFTLLDAWNTGHSGGIASIHANSAKDALLRLETIVPIKNIVRLRSMIANAVHLIVFIDREPGVSVGRKVREIVFVAGYSRERNDYDLFYL